MYNAFSEERYLRILSNSFFFWLFSQKIVVYNLGSLLYSHFLYFFVHVFQNSSAITYHCKYLVSPGSSGASSWPSFDKVYLFLMMHYALFHFFISFSFHPGYSAYLRTSTAFAFILLLFFSLLLSSSSHLIFAYWSVLLIYSVFSIFIFVYISQSIDLFLY